MDNSNSFKCKGKESNILHKECYLVYKKKEQEKFKFKVCLK